jgi:hypothetical protein
VSYDERKKFLCKPQVVIVCIVWIVVLIFPSYGDHFICTRTTMSVSLGGAARSKPAKAESSTTGTRSGRPVVWSPRQEDIGESPSDDTTSWRTLTPPKFSEQLSDSQTFLFRKQ